MMTGSDKFWLCPWSIAATVVVIFMTFMFINSRSDRLAEVEKATACIKQDSEWRPLTVSNYIYMSCVKPQK